jgi:hypothetical protein
MGSPLAMHSPNTLRIKNVKEGLNKRRNLRSDTSAITMNAETLLRCNCYKSQLPTPIQCLQSTVLYGAITENFSGIDKTNNLSQQLNFLHLWWFYGKKKVTDKNVTSLVPLVTKICTYKTLSDPTETKINKPHLTILKTSYEP